MRTRLLLKFLCLLVAGSSARNDHSHDLAPVILHDELKHVEFPHEKKFLHMALPIILSHHDGWQAHHVSLERFQHVVFVQCLVICHKRTS